MEFKGYREALEFLENLFPGRVFIGISEFAEISGLNYKTVYDAIEDSKNPLPSKILGKKRIIIPIPALARWMVS